VSHFFLIVMFGLCVCSLGKTQQSPGSERNINLGTKKVRNYIWLNCYTRNRHRLAVDLQLVEHASLGTSWYSRIIAYVLNVA